MLPICSPPINVLDLQCGLMRLVNLRHLVVCLPEILTRLASWRLSALVLYGSECPLSQTRQDPKHRGLELLLASEDRGGYEYKVFL